MKNSEQQKTKPNYNNRLDATTAAVRKSIVELTDDQNALSEWLSKLEKIRSYDLKEVNR